MQNNNKNDINTLPIVIFTGIKYYKYLMPVWINNTGGVIILHFTRKDMVEFTEKILWSKNTVPLQSSENLKRADIWLGKKTLEHSTMDKAAPSEYTICTKI